MKVVADNDSGCRLGEVKETKQNKGHSVEKGGVERGWGRRVGEWEYM